MAGVSSICLTIGQTLPRTSGLEYSMKMAFIVNILELQTNALFNPKDGTSALQVHIQLMPPDTLVAKQSLIKVFFMSL
jgi:hypothetical protein